jgi:acetyl esterase/lipase
MWGLEFCQVKLVGAILMQPFFGGEERTESEIRLDGAPVLSMERTDWAWKAFLPEGANRNHEAAHVFESIKAGIEEAFPPALVVIGGFDPLHDWQLRYVLNQTWYLLDIKLHIFGHEIIVL